MSYICIPVRMNLIKAHGGKGSGPFSFERLATSPPQADHVLVDLFFIHGRRGAAVKLPDSYRMVPCDWIALARTVLTPAQFTVWRLEYSQ